MVIADDVSQNAISAFIGAFIFSIVGNDRVFDHDPRFGLVVLSEIASRALSAAVNDPGTAIDDIGRLVRLFVLWSDRTERNDGAAKKRKTPLYDRVEVPELSVRDMLDDAFSAIGRDGATMVEVAIRLQKDLRSLPARSRHRPSNPLTLSSCGTGMSSPNHPPDPAPGSH